MGRKKSEINTEVLRVAISPEIKTQLEAIAEQNESSLAGATRLVIQRGLNVNR